MLDSKPAVDFIHFTEASDLSKCRAIIPSVGVGNVGQLAIDLLISSLNMKKIGTIWHPAIMPIIGSAAFNQDNKTDQTIACELYFDAINKLIAVQIRSPIVAPLVNDFLTELITFFKSEKISEVIILTSSYAYEMHDIEGTPLRYVSDERFQEKYKNQLQELKWIQCGNDVIHGGGYAKQLWAKTVENGIQSVILFRYSSEGDNIPDANSLLNYLNDLLEIIPKDGNNAKLTIPISWQYLFGNAVPENMY